MYKFSTIPTQELKIYEAKYDGYYIGDNGITYDTWLVDSESTDETYIVERNRKNGKTRCNCISGQVRGKCKHITKIRKICGDEVD